MIRLFLTAAICAFAATSALAEPLTISQISAYLNTIKAAQGRFTQISSDGSISTGEISIKRPGKIRFDYDPPELALVLASSGAVYILDRKLAAEPKTYPLRRTPLSILLARKVDLARDAQIIDHGEGDGFSYLRARDPKRPDQGSIELRLTHEPIALREWVITDADGYQTVIILESLQELKPSQLPNKMFYIDPELERLRR